MMKPILFNADMVRAILDGSKTVTRRVVKPQPELYGLLEPNWDWHEITRLYRPGDILYVRETHYKDAGRYMYKADYSDNEKFYQNGKEFKIKWRPSIHMPKEAARIFLRVTGVRVERLQEMTGGDLLKEGIDLFQSNFVRVAFDEFSALWDSTIKPTDLDVYSWEANPWVWVIEFERVSKEEALKGE